MIKNSDQKLYIGITDDPQQRVREHNTSRGARFTKYIQTFEIVFLEDYQTLAEARKREVQIKKWRRDKKDVLVTRYQAGLPTKYD